MRTRDLVHNVFASGVSDAAVGPVPGFPAFSQSRERAEALGGRRDTHPAHARATASLRGTQYRAPNRGTLFRRTPTDITALVMRVTHRFRERMAEFHMASAKELFTCVGRTLTW
jgi:hypothetical protein